MPTHPPEPNDPEPPIPPSGEGPGAFERDLADRLLDQRIVAVAGRLDDATADRAARRLVLLGSRSEEPITLHLTCTDSDLGASLALADAVEVTAAPVHAVVRGTLRGPALAVLCAASTRTAHRHALLVLSLPEEAAEGTATRLAGLAEQHRHQVAQLRRRLADVTGRSVDDVAADLEAGRLLSAEEAEDYGLVERTTR